MTNWEEFSGHLIGGNSLGSVLHWDSDLKVGVLNIYFNYKVTVYVVLKDIEEYFGGRWETLRRNDMANSVC